MKQDSFTGICPISNTVILRAKCLDCYAMKEITTKWKANHALISSFIVDCSPEETNKKLLSEDTNKAN